LVAPAVSVPMATMEMFGQFEMVIDGRKVEWCRRRDRQIVAYLALQLDTSATRYNLLTKFWPNTDQQLASQSLRTACSTIRRAIAQCVGYDRVHYYFTAGRAVRLNTDNISISSIRLRGHIREAEDAFSHGQSAGALAHYLAISRIYRAPLLDSEGTEPWFRTEREVYGTMAAMAGERVLELRTQQRVHALPEPAVTQLLFST
jgi:DNA-binding SARP family transcriptional activator